MYCYYGRVFVFVAVSTVVVVNERTDGMDDVTTKITVR